MGGSATLGCSLLTGTPMPPTEYGTPPRVPARRREPQGLEMWSQPYEHADPSSLAASLLTQSDLNLPEYAEMVCCAAAER